MVQTLANIGTDTKSPFFAKLEEHRRKLSSMTDDERAAMEEKRQAEEREWILRGQRQHMIEKSLLEPELLTRTLDTFPLVDLGQEDALKLCKLFVAHFNRKRRRGLFLWGKPGRGKSGMMQGVAVGVLNKPQLFSVIYIACGEIDRLISEGVDIELAAVTCDLVIWDDLEKGLQTPGNKFKPNSDKIIRSAINRADRNRKNTHCFTSNYPLDAIKRQWPALGSRLAGLTVECEVKGPDMRERVDAGEEECWWAQ